MAGASEVDQSGEGLREEWGTSPEGHGSHRWSESWEEPDLVLPKPPCGHVCLGGLFSAIWGEVWPQT